MARLGLKKLGQNFTFCLQTFFFSLDTGNNHPEDSIFFYQYFCKALILSYNRTCINLYLKHLCSRIVTQDLHR